MTKKQFTQGLVAISLVLLICIILIPNRWLIAVLVLLGSGTIYLINQRLASQLTLSEQQMIRQSADLAVENSPYLSGKAPCPMYIYDESNQLQWMNDRGIALREQYGDSLWQDKLLPLLTTTKSGGQIAVGSTNFRYVIWIFIWYNAFRQDRR